MYRIFPWLKNKSASRPRQEFIESFIVHKQTSEYLSYIKQKEHRLVCTDAFFHLLPTIPDGDYMSMLFELITNNSRLTSKELSTIIVNKLSRAISESNFDLAEQILNLPLKSIQISLPTYEIVQLIHTCPNANQKLKLLSILIEKNLPYDKEYITWILIILFETYIIGDEIIIEYILNIKKNLNLLFTCYGNNNVTPLMLFLHLYSNDKCQLLIDHYLSNINDQSIFLQCDKWNRSYLSHLLCGKCQHGDEGNSFEVLPDEINKQHMDRCPHSSAILEKFSMLHKLGNGCKNPIKTILISQYCLSLRIILFNYLYENDPSFELKLDEFFHNFPPQSIKIYSNYLKRLVRNQDLNPALTYLVQNSMVYNPDNDQTIKFLLRQGGRIKDMNSLKHIISHHLSSTRSMIPFMLLDYSMYVDIPFDRMSTVQNKRISLYVCRLIQCGYPSDYRQNFEEFKIRLEAPLLKLVNQLIDLKKPQCLSKLCLQKLRSSLKDLGDETQDKLKDDLPIHLKQSITKFGHEECSIFFQTVALT